MLCAAVCKALSFMSVDAYVAVLVVMDLVIVLGVDGPSVNTVDPRLCFGPYICRFSFVSQHPVGLVAHFLTRASDLSSMSNCTEDAHSLYVG